MASAKRKRKLPDSECDADVGNEPKQKKRKVNDAGHSTKNSNAKNGTKAAKKKRDINESEEDKFVFILAHGAGTNSQHPNIQNWENRLSALGHKVVTFDFKKPYNKMERLVSTYQAVIDETIQKYKGYKLVLIGTSMGSRVSIHLSNMNSLPSSCSHIIALGYPLFAKRKTGNVVRDTPLLEFINSTDAQLTQARLLLISGSKDHMAPKDAMDTFYEKVRRKKVGSKQKCELHWIEGGNHSLKVGKRHPISQNEV
eukprot:CAMPEP_0197046330 /NCGR_PEP_ID=MMETSP1384-20130603/22056_1 /TAXON_ID=29189 /ORGANISM="Ammonia sp." /LENGTH=254 /DNA_ID=CAMNT_0042478097 /DNA_START=39 /DNA_END=800 /DNA_ORIENTATION=+